MSSLSNLVELIKTAALEAVDSTDPSAVIFGTVKSTEPLNIYVNQKLTLTEDFIILTRNVTDYEVEMDTELSTSDATIDLEDGDISHSHEIKGKFTYKVHNALKSGDKVIMIRQQGGQSYVVIDRIGGE